MKMVKFMKQLMNEYVGGRSGEGKTNYCLVRAKELEEDLDAKCLFFDSKEVETLPGEWTHADRDFEFEDIKRAGKVHYHPHSDRAAQIAELSALVHNMWSDESIWVVIVDEVRNVAKKGEDHGPAQRIASQGRKPGVIGLFNSQRPQSTSDEVLSQNQQIVLFRPHPVFGEPYWKRKLDADQWELVDEKLDAGGQYSYVTITGEGIAGPFKEDAVI